MQAARGASLTSGDRPASPPPPRPRRRCVAVFAGVALLAYLLDLVTKVLAVRALTPREPVELLGEVLQLYLARNPGAAFSSATGYTEVLTGIAVVAALVVLWLTRRLGSLGWALGLGFLLGGVLGNLTDRMFRSPGPLRGHVVDFLMLPNFPVFNVADICINIAAGLIIVQAIRGIRVDGLRHDDEHGPAAASTSRAATDGKPHDGG